MSLDIFKEKGFTLLHENVTDALRGRTFSALYTLVRLCVLLSMPAPRRAAKLVR